MDSPHILQKKCGIYERGAIIIVEVEYLKLNIHLAPQLLFQTDSLRDKFYSC